MHSMLFTHSCKTKFIFMSLNQGLSPKENSLSQNLPFARHITLGCSLLC